MTLLSTKVKKDDRLMLYGKKSSREIAIKIITEYYNYLKSTDLNYTGKPDVYDFEQLLRIYIKQKALGMDNIEVAQYAQKHWHDDKEILESINIMIKEKADIIKTAEIILATGAIQIRDYNTIIKNVRNKNLEALYSHLGLKPEDDAEMVKLYEKRKEESVVRYREGEDAINPDQVKKLINYCKKQFKAEPLFERLLFGAIARDYTITSNDKDYDEKVEEIVKTLAWKYNRIEQGEPTPRM